MNIHLHIERLILDGLPAGAHQASQVHEAVEAELTRLFATEGLSLGSQSGWAVPSLHGGEIQLTAEDHPYQLGTRIAQSLHGSLQSGSDQQVE